MFEKSNILESLGKGTDRVRIESEVEQRMKAPTSVDKKENVMNRKNNFLLCSD